MQFTAPQWGRKTVHLEALQFTDVINLTAQRASSPPQGVVGQGQNAVAVSVEVTKHSAESSSSAQRQFTSSEVNQRRHWVRHCVLCCEENFCDTGVHFRTALKASDNLSSKLGYHCSYCF
jgi:hypothetical protein